MAQSPPTPDPPPPPPPHFLREQAPSHPPRDQTPSPPPRESRRVAATLIDLDAAEAGGAFNGGQLIGYIFKAAARRRDSRGGGEEVWSRER